MKQDKASPTAANMSLGQHLVGFVDETCILGRDPVTGEAYRADGKELCVTVKRYLAFRGHKDMFPRTFNALIVKCCPVVKIEVGGRVVFLGISPKDNVRTYTETNKSILEPSTIDQDRSLTKDQEYRRRRKLARIEAPSLIPKDNIASFVEAHAIRPTEPTGREVEERIPKNPVKRILGQESPLPAPVTKLFTGLSVRPGSTLTFPKISGVTPLEPLPLSAYYNTGQHKPKPTYQANQTVKLRVVPRVNPISL